MTTTADPSSPITVHPPEPHDGVRIWQLMCEVLGDDEGAERDSRETCLVLARHFRETSLVAVRGEQLVGFVVGWRPPQTPDTLFVWRIGVAPQVRRQGLGRRMLRRLLSQEACRDVAYLEALLTPSQRELRKLLGALARELGAPTEVDLELSRHDFEPPDGQAPPHEEENRFCIGPIDHDQLGGLLRRGAQPPPAS